MDAATIAKINEAAKALRIARNSFAYITAIKAIDMPGIPIVCGKRTGAARYASSKSWQKQTAVLLTRAGISHECTNIAPKGGLAGDRITVILQARIESK